MTPADWLIVLAILTSVVIGLIRGLVVEVMALVVWALAIIVTVLFAPRLSDALTGAIETPSARIFLAYALIFVGSLLIGAIATWLLRRLVDGTGLSGTDRLLGGVFGVVRGGVLVVITVLMLGLTPFPRDQWWRESRLLPPFVELAERARAMLPVRISDQIRFDGSALEPTPSSGPSGALTRADNPFHR